MDQAPDTTNPIQKNLGRYTVGFLFVAILILVALTITIRFFDQWPIEGTGLAIDWKTIWQGIRDAQLHYEVGLRNPPWSVLFILPLGLFSFRSSWGMITLVTIGVLLWSVPRIRNRWYYLLTVFLLIVSYVSLRQIADGNLEGLVIGGILLLILGDRKDDPLLLALGILIVTAKIQEIWLLLFVLIVYLLSKWPRQKWLTLGGAVALAVIPSMLIAGQNWLTSGLPLNPERDGVVNMTLQASLTGLAFPPWFIVFAWIAILSITLYVALRTAHTMGREKVAMLVSASMLLAPYAAGNSWLTVLAIGGIPLLQSNFVLGMFLYIIGSAGALFPLDFALQWSATYWTIVLLISWIIFSILVWRRHQQTIQNMPVT